MTEATGLQIDVVVDHKCLLGEGPLWDDTRKSVYWLDILKGEIHEYATEKRVRRTIPVFQMVGSIAICKDGSLIAALKNGFAFVDPDTGQVRMIGDPESHLVNNRFNDGKCDPAGRFWAGTMSLSEEQHAGAVYVVDKNLVITQKINDVTISNGMAWSPDNNKFYYIDTPAFEVAAYDYEIGTGNIINREVVIKISREDGYPDGMTIDNEGMLWIAHWDGWQVTRWNPATGEKLMCIKLPVGRVTSCCFGGDQLQDLYITSAQIGLSADELELQPLAGSLFVIRNIGFTGIESFKFG
jgi:sugar lactone lactonase YvrE